MFPKSTDIPTVTNVEEYGVIECLPDTKSAGWLQSDVLFILKISSTLKRGQEDTDCWVGPLRLGHSCHSHSPAAHTAVTVLALAQLAKCMSVATP